MVLQWGAKRDFIRRLHNAAPRLAVAAKVLSAVRVLLTRSQKKRKRRKARRAAAAKAQPVELERPGGGLVAFSP